MQDKVIFFSACVVLSWVVYSLSWVSAESRIAGLGWLMIGMVAVYGLSWVLWYLIQVAQWLVNSRRRKNYGR